MPKESSKKGTGKSQAGLTPWPAGVSGNPKGRPPKIYNIIKKAGYAKTDITTAFFELSFYDAAALKKLYEKDDTPIILKVIAKALANAAAKGDMSQVKDLLQYVLGKPKQGLELSGPGGGPIQQLQVPGDVDYSALSDGALQEIMGAMIVTKK